MTRKNKKRCYINLPMLLTIRQYLQSKKRLHKKTISNILTFTDNLIKYEDEDEFQIPSNYTRKQFRDYKLLQKLLQKNNYLSKISNKGFNKAENFSFTDEFKKYDIFQFSIDDVIGFFTKDGIRIDIFQGILEEIHSGEEKKIKTARSILKNVDKYEQDMLLRDREMEEMMKFQEYGYLEPGESIL